MKKPAFWYKLSFRSKVFLSYFFIILILTLNLGFFCIHIIKRDANERSEKAYGDILAQMTESLSYKLSENHLSSEFIKSNTALVNALQKTDTTPWQRYVNYKSIVDPLINSISNTNPQILSVRLYHNNPVLVNHSPSIISMTQLENNGSIKRLTQENDIYYSQGDSLFFLSMLPETTRNAPEVILEICIDLHSMFSFRIESLDSYLFSVIDNKAGNLIWQQNFIPDFDPAILLTIDQSDELIKNGKEEYRVYQQPVPEMNWSICLTVPQDRLHHGADHFINTVIFVVSLCFALALMISFLFSRSLTKRINQLNSHISLIEKGNLQALIQTDYQDEIGHLMTHFNDMTISLNHSMNELKEKENKQKEAEMRALRAQINPHFLYNTLSLISWKAIDQGANEVAYITGVFSRFCRSVLNRGNYESTLSDELKNVQYYVEIQQKMHDHSFTVDYQVPEKYYPCIVPNFIIQPLVENAIIHGLDNVRNLNGILRIDVSDNGQDLYIDISNNGKKFTQSELDEIFAADEKGYGLKNVQQRIVYMYGSDYGVSIQNPIKGFTTCVRLKLRKG